MDKETQWEYIEICMFSSDLQLIRSMSIRYHTKGGLPSTPSLLLHSGQLSKQKALGLTRIYSSQRHLMSVPQLEASTIPKVPQQTRASFSVLVLYAVMGINVLDYFSKALTST